MSIFDTRRAASADKHFLNSLVNGGAPDMIVWKSPVEDFNTNSVLTVNPGEKALFYQNGQLMQVFGPGRFELKTENYPFLSDLRNVLSGGESTFRCQVYFVRTALSQEVLWGTDSPIQLRDPVQQIQTALIGRGAYKIRVMDAALFITKLVGFIDEFNTRSLDLFFHSQFLQTIKSHIARDIAQSQQEILGVITRLDELALQLKRDLAPVFASFGLTLEIFSIAALDIPDDDPNRKALEAAYRRTREMQIMGKDYQLIKTMGIMEDMANNQAAAGAGAGMGMGMAAFGLMGQMSQNMFQAAQPMVGGMAQGATQGTAQGASQGMAQGAAQGMAQGATPGAADPQAKLTKLKGLLDAGLISQADYDAAKKQILADLVG